MPTGISNIEMCAHKHIYIYIYSVCVEVKYSHFKKLLFSLISSIFGENVINLNFYN